MTSSAATWPELSADHPLTTFAAKLDTVLEEADYDEVYGIHLRTATPFQRNLILQKFLRANTNDVSKASQQLLSTLKWRKEYKPLGASDQTYSYDRFGGLGYVTTLTKVPGSPNEKDIATFNIYGAVTDNNLTFGDLSGFMTWRIALMELTLQKLDLANATTPIPDYLKGPDPHQALQIHDYLNVAFLRQDPAAKAAAGEAIKVFTAYYPETLSKKLFVNTPFYMSWMFTAMKVFMPAETTKKLKAITYGKDLVYELGDSVPMIYGGKGTELEVMGETVKYDSQEK